MDLEAAGRIEADSLGSLLAEADSLVEVADSLAVADTLLDLAGN